MEDLTAAVGTEIRHWWPKMRIYRDQVPNGFNTPCIYIHQTGVSSEPGNIGSREWRTYHFQAIWFAPDEAETAEYTTMQEQMLDWLHVAKKRYGMTARDVSVDEVHATVAMTFDMRLLVAYDETHLYQQRLNLKVGVKDDDEENGPA